MHHCSCHPAALGRGRGPGSTRDGRRLLCQREGMRPGISALGRDRDAPGQTSALSLGPRPWQLPAPCRPLFRLSPDGHGTRCPEAGRGRETARHSVLQVEMERAAAESQETPKATSPGLGVPRDWTPFSALSCVCGLPKGWGRPSQHFLPPSPARPVPGTDRSPGTLKQETPHQHSSSVPTRFAWTLSSI